MLGCFSQKSANDIVPQRKVSMLEWQRNQEVYDGALRPEPRNRTAYMRVRRKPTVECKRSSAESCTQWTHCLRFFSNIMLEEILHIRNVRHAVKRVISNGAPAELMECRQINFVTTLTRIGNPCSRIFSLALATHKPFGK